jgi:hypothetical protein
VWQHRRSCSTTRPGRVRREEPTRPLHTPHRRSHVAVPDVGLQWEETEASKHRRQSQEAAADPNQAGMGGSRVLGWGKGPADDDGNGA